MKSLIAMMLIFLIINMIAIFRFILFSNMNKRMVIFSLVMINLFLGGYLFVQHKGVDNLNKTNLLIVGIILAVVMFFVYYNDHGKK